MIFIFCQGVKYTSSALHKENDCNVDGITVFICCKPLLLYSTDTDTDTRS